MKALATCLWGLLSPAAKAVDAPISAMRGTIPQEDMISEALGVGGLAMAGGGAVGVPRGAVGANAADLRRQANIDRFGYDPNETPEVDTSYRGGHQPVGPQDENPVRLDDVTISTTGEQAGYPSDFYSSQGQRQYAQGPRFADDEFGLSNQQSYRAIQAARGNPDAEVTIYRGVPNEESITSINAGDFVTLSPKYAELHASSGYGPRGEDAGKVISQKVKVKDVYFAGDDDQCIYSWMGVDVKDFLNASDNKTILHKSYRLPRNIYNVADSMVSQLGTRQEKIWMPKEESGVVVWHHDMLGLDLTNGEWLILARTNYIANKIATDLKEQGYLFWREGSGWSISPNVLTGIEVC